MSNTHAADTCPGFKPGALCVLCGDSRSWHAQPADRRTASTITDAQLDELHQRIDTLEHVAAGNKRHVQLIVPELERAKAAVARASTLADLWQAAHGSAMFLVRAAGTELSDVLAEEPAPEHDWYHPTPLSGRVCRRCDLIHKFWTGEACVADEPAQTMAAVECSAEYHGHQLARPCIRAAQHHGDHIDEHGYHWSDTVAVYPIADGEDAYTGPLVPPILMEAIRKDEAARTHLAGAVEVRDPCPHCEDCRLIPRAFMSAHIERHHPDIRADKNRPDSANTQVNQGAAKDSTADTEPPQQTRGQRLLDALLYRGPGYEVSGHDHQACPYCTGAPQFWRSELGAHIEARHAPVLAVLASGVSLDELLHNAAADSGLARGETRR